MEALNQLKDFQKLLNARNRGQTDADWRVEKLLLFEQDGFFYLQFYGSPFDQSFRDFLKLLSSPEVASRVKALTFLSPDVGGNGTRHWDFSLLLDSEVGFPELTTLFIDPGEPDQHNHPIIAKMSDYEEAGMLGRFLLKSPKLQALTAPSAPDSTFFQSGNRPVAYMRIETGIDHQNFILNLSQASNLPELRALDFGEYCHEYIPDYQKDCTPFDHYRQLFESATFSRIKVFYLRNSILTPEEIARLRAIRNFSLIESRRSYK